MERLFVKGMTWGWNSIRGDYRSAEAIDSLRKLKETGSEWICLSFYTFQDHVHSTTIHYDYAYTMTDRDIQFAVAEARKLGLKVCLKPVVNSKDGLWRANIGFPQEESASHPYWEEWFTSYTAFLLHYAELAEELECEMFCLGCEMVKTETQTERWRRTIDQVRKVYGGLLIYNANHGKEEGVEWFDQVDLIGTSAYYPVAEAPGESEASMMQRWLPIRDKLEQLHRKFNKPIVFVEIGCRSAEGCAMMPWDFKHVELPVSEDEQANFYRSVIKVFWNAHWFSGFFWWDWSVKLYPLEEARNNRGFDIYGKKAEAVVKEWYMEH
jgi:hypothetical protein